jgi:hypothetical protein
VKTPSILQGSQEHSEAVQLDRSGKVSLIMLIVIVGFVASVFFRYTMSVYLGRGYPYNTPLYLPSLVGTDFTDYIQITKDLNPYLGSAASAYYPVMNMLFYFFSLRVGPGHTMVVPAQLYSLLVVLALAWFSFIYLRTDRLWEHLTRTFVFTFMTYPVLFALDRGNVETLLLIFLFLFFYFFQRQRFLISSLFLALAITTKLFPLFLLVLFVPQKKYREIGITLALSIVLTMACLMCFKGGLIANFKFLLAGENLHSKTVFGGSSDVYLGGNYLVQRGISLFTVIKVFLIETGYSMLHMHGFLRIYVAAAAVAAILVAGYVTFIESELWKRATILVVAMLVLPQISADYKMIHLLIPLFLFANSTERSGMDTIYALLFGLLLIPKDYYFLPKTISDAGGAHDISIAIFLNPAIMLLMSSLIIAGGLRRWRETRRQRLAYPLPVEQSLASN